MSERASSDRAVFGARRGEPSALSKYFQDTAFWPASGALVVAMLILPARRCGPVLVLCLSTSIVLDLYTNEAIFESSLYSCATAVANFGVARLTRRYTCARRRSARRNGSRYPRRR